MLATSIRKSIADAIAELVEQEGDEDARDSGITSDDYSMAVESFVPEIERLSEMPGGLELALDLLHHYMYRKVWDLNRTGQQGPRRMILANLG